MIIDQGGTKADIALIDRNRVEKIVGITPLYSGNTFHIPPRAKEVKEKIEEVYFYGAGMYSLERKSLCEQAIRQQLSHINFIHVESDMVGAARAVCGNTSGVVCILGTGSNASFFDGESMQPIHPSLGYIIGDEGSGVEIGKAVLKSYFYKSMSEEARHFLERNYIHQKAKLLKNVNDATIARAFIASYASIPLESDDDQLKALVKNEFVKFFESRILTHGEYLSYPIHFVGSIAYFYASFIKELCDGYNLNVGHIIQKPIEGLINYHNG